MEKLGKLLLRLRLSKRLSQTEVADALGIHQTTYSNWEKDEVSPKLEYVEPLARLFDVPAWVFLDKTTVEQLEAIMGENQSLRLQLDNMKDRKDQDEENQSDDRHEEGGDNNMINRYLAHNAHPNL